MAFAQLGLNPLVVKAVEASGYTQPTAVQAQSIPATLEGTDLLVSSQTGSGKTAAFMLPCLHRLDQPSALPGRGPRILVLTPTRELAQQVTRAADTYGKFLKRLRTVAVVGGAPFHVQAKLLSQPVDVVVATPGRLIDHIERGRIDFSRLETLILDEADRMLDMGFIDDIEAIIARTPATRQTLLFSATLEGVVGRLAGRVTKSARRIEIETAPELKAKIEQRIHFADDFSHKSRLLDHLLRDAELSQAVVFTSTKKSADDLAVQLRGEGFAAEALHGDMSQRDRNRTLQGAAPGPHPRAGGHRRRRARHRRAGHQPCHQLRPAAPGRGLRAPHRPHRPRRARGHRHQPGGAFREAADPRHRALHRAVDPRRRHCRTGAQDETGAARRLRRQAPRRRAAPCRRLRQGPWRQARLRRSQDGVRRKTGMAPRRCAPWRRRQAPRLERLKKHPAPPGAG
jgi:hypothetical protein